MLGLRHKNEKKSKVVTVFGYRSKPFTFLKFSIQPFDEGTIIIPIYRLGNWGMDNLGELHKFIEIVSSSGV